jgi:glycosyltransferase involved in cell wall biosynthesis
MITINHVVDLPCANPWLNGIATYHDRSRFRHLVASLGPKNGLHEALEGLGLRTFSLDAPSRWQLPLAVARLARQLRQERVDIVQTHLFDPTTVGLIAAKVAATPFTIVTRHHSDFTTVFNHPFHRRIDRWHALTADRVMAASEAVKRAMIQHEGVPEGRIGVARYGYDFDALSPRLSADERRSLREELGGDAHQIIGTVSRLSVEKGHRYLIDAIPAVVGRFQDARFVFVGTGPLHEELEAHVAARGVDPYVRFLGWRSDALRIIEAVDVMAHPSLHEAFCSVIIESMALERPLVTTEVAAAPEQIDHGETGLLVPPRDPGSIAEAVCSLLGDRQRAQKMGVRARERVVERFNFPRMMCLYEDLYSGWLSQKHGRRV